MLFMPSVLRGLGKITSLHRFFSINIDGRLFDISKTKVLKNTLRAKSGKLSLTMVIERGANASKVCNKMYRSFCLRYRQRRTEMMDLELSFLCLYYHLPDLGIAT